ncbi:class I SAM-dependent methyltransferase [Daejeonella lutea]|uniref:Methyltransferase domain-containing protein n=1 Tax=Daejeonella lutea TaxID=572036 RepID=A0A1T5B518_9SPHI|nr:class I SAM-dependent methyltransferase [Daejeonella lutea]SKB42354.1 hypothetical protein SAMN05661099_1299 [Daejeonella lutea]
MQDKTLREIFYNHDGRLIHKWDHYFEIYEKFFSKYKGRKLNMLEIGISQGGSLDLWKNYFGDEINLYAIDINPLCKQFEDPKTKIFIGSQSDKQFLSDVIAQLPDLDIVLDDGGHTMEQQIVSFEMLYPKVKEGGLFIVEDTHTSYWYEFHGGLKKPGSFIEYSKDLVDSLYEDHVQYKDSIVRDERTRHINSVAFYDSIVVFEKLKRPKAFHTRRGEESIASYVPTELKKQTFFMRLRKSLFGKKRVHTFSKNDKGIGN